MYDSAVRWLKHEVTERAQYKQEILSSIRFPQISKTYLTNVVEQEPLLQDSCECLRMVIGRSSLRLKHLYFFELSSYRIIFLKK